MLLIVSGFLLVLFDIRLSICFIPAPALRGAIKKSAGGVWGWGAAAVSG